MMQQTVLLTAVRGPDGVAKYHPSKYLLRWFRRCVLLSAMDGRVLSDPVEPNGGSFTGPSVREERLGTKRFQAILDTPIPPKYRVQAMDAMEDTFWEYLRSLDELPHHFQLHFMHAIEILGYKHPDYGIRGWWYARYVELAHDMHLQPEALEDLDARLGDDRAEWAKRNHKATIA